MGQWLIADVSLLDVHAQVWMPLAQSYRPVLVHLRLGDTIVFGEVLALSL
jgi:hypothetical protein